MKKHDKQRSYCCLGLKTDDTLAFHALVDDTIKKTTAMVTERRAAVGMLLELMLRPSILRVFLLLRMS